MKITVLCEGRTETAFKLHLHVFLKTRLAGKMPRLRFDKHDGPIPTEGKLQRVVSTLLYSGKPPSDAVIALTDVYPAFKDANDAKQKLNQWVGNEARFHAHVALHDFEAWLLPYWEKIKVVAGSNRAPFGDNPEQVNHNNPPSKRLRSLFETGKCRDSYSKPRDAGRILRNEDLMVAANACPELKAFLNTIIGLCDEEQVIP